MTRTAEEQQEYINRLIKRLSKDYKVVIEPYMKTADGEYNWFFNWNGGGYNNIWAKSKRDAIKKIKEKFSLWGDGIDESSLRRQTSQDSRETDRMGHMMTC